MSSGGVKRVLPLEMLWENYELEKVLYEGRRATIWRCRDRTTRRTYACKHFDLSSLSDGSRYVRRATNELKTLLSLRGVASNVVQLEEAYGDKRSLFIVMELCASGDLVSRIKRKGPLSEDRARDVFISVLLAVKQCHERGVIHGGVSPDHVLLKHSPSAIMLRSTSSAPTSPTSPFVAPAGVPIGPLLQQRLKAKALSSKSVPHGSCSPPPRRPRHARTPSTDGSKRFAAANSYLRGGGGAFAGSCSVSGLEITDWNHRKFPRGSSRGSGSSSCSGSISGGGRSNGSACSPVAKLTGLSLATQHESLRAMAAVLMSPDTPRHSNDIWGLGLVLYCMLSGDVSRSPSDRTVACCLTLNGVSQPACNLVHRLMSGDAAERPTLEDILRDPWLDDEGDEEEEEEGEEGEASEKGLTARELGVLLRLPSMRKQNTRTPLSRDFDQDDA